MGVCSSNRFGQPPNGRVPGARTPRAAGGACATLVAGASSQPRLIGCAAAAALRATDRRVCGWHALWAGVGGKGVQPDTLAWVDVPLIL